MNEGVCKWESDENGIWSSGCGETFDFYDGGPIDNGFKFCPYCGKFLSQSFFDKEDSQF
jgi:hypothetical protein